MNADKLRENFQQFARWMVGVFIFLSIVKIIFIPLNQLRGLGDITHFYNLAQIPGLPFVDYWVEFPPIPVFLFESFYWLVAEDFQNFTYLFLIFITLVNAGNLYVFSQILAQIRNLSDARKRNSLFFYLLVLSFLTYSWWYFDGLTVLLLLSGFYCFIKEKELLSIGLISLGILTKLFPALFLAVFLKKKIKLCGSLKRIILLLIVVGLPYFVLWLASAEMTAASLVSQAMKGSWETVWALIDGNYQTGNFGPLWERLDPALAYRQIGYPPRVDSRITLAAFGLLGLLSIWRRKITSAQHFSQLVLFTFCIFFLWSPGWSPQWVLYLIPFLLFAIPNTRLGIGMAVLLILINLFEWPVILGLQLLSFLPLTIFSRTLIFAVLSVYLYQRMGAENKYGV
jgi:hypothetical protein